MAWFADLAGKAESLLNNIDEQTGAVLRNHANNKDEHEVHDKSDTPWAQSRRSTNTKRTVSKFETKPTTAQIKNVPQRSPQSKIKNMDTQVNSRPPRKISPIRKSSPNNIKNPRPLVENAKTNEVRDQTGLRRRRNSLPSNLESVNNQELVYNMQNLEVENAMLKNEINVLNKEVSELIEQLRKSENDTDALQHELGKSEKLNSLIKNAKESLDAQMEELKLQISNKSAMEIAKHKEKSQELESEVNLLNDKNKHLEDRILYLEEEITSKDSRIGTVEKDLRSANAKITELESALNKTTSESQNLEKDLEAYKLRVKNMLHAKDDEIKHLRNGSNLNEKTKMLMEQIDSLKIEKRDLASCLSRSIEENREACLFLTQLEQLRSAAERLSHTLREAVKEERAARNKAEAQCDVLTKDLQSLEMRSGLTIANLKLALQSKEEELNLLKESTSTVATANTSALNVADYDVIQSDKIQCLTQTLIQKQGKIDSLLADNNTLRIQLGKLEAKYKAEMSFRAKNSHSVVHLQDGDGRRARHMMSPLSSLSLKMGVMIKKYPMFRTFLMCYMIGLHLWVMTVLFTSTPQDYAPKPSSV